MSDALSPGTIIGRRYVVVAAAGRARVCLHYRAEEIDTRAILTIAEWFPDGLTVRTPEGAAAPAAADAAPRYEESRRRFLARAHSLFQLAHPGLERSRAPVEERNTVYAIAEPVDGPTLATWALGRTPTQGEIDALLAPLLDALAALHDAGMLHLAITPDAIVLRDGRTPVLTGLWAGARALPGAAAGYLAPELLAGQPAKIGPRTDIYALAATIHALLTGTPPARSTLVEGETWLPSAIPTIGSDYRPEFLQGVATCLAPDPARRPPGAAALKSLVLDDARDDALDEPSTANATAREKPKAPETFPQDALASPPAARIPASSAAAEKRRVPWLPILLLGGSILAGLGYLGMRPTLPPPKATPERAAVESQAKRPAQAPGPQLEAGRQLQRTEETAQAILRRIAQATDRNELRRIAEAAPAHRGAVEARLAALGYLRLVKRDAVVWLRPDESFRECDDCPDMVVLPAATFLMGSPSSEPGRGDDEDDSPGPGGNPVPVTIARPFAIGKYEVTRGQFAAFVQATSYRVDPGCYARERRRQLRPELSWTTPGFEQDDKHPVTCVSWQDAVAYVRWLSATTGAGYRLLTEAEWEYAARGGSTARFAFGDNELESCRYGNGADLTSREADPDWIVAPCRDGFRYTAPVGSFLPNAFGLHDMHGNLWEWVEDCRSDSLQHLSSPAASGGAGASRSCASDTPRILRGGSWSDPPGRLRSAARVAGPPDARDHIVGLRVARSLELGR